MPSIVTLTTDFEEQEPYVASAKGVLCARCPGVQILDLSHQIPRNSIPEGALFIAGAAPYFPKETVHIVAVASGPHPLAVSLNQQFVICPDNGVITMLAERYEIEEARIITNPDLLPSVEGQTYYARDVFAPAAALLASGAPLQDVGDTIENVTRLNLPHSQKDGKDLVSGQVIHVNRFGTLVTNIHQSVLEGTRPTNVEVGGFSVGPLSESYSQVDPGCPVALFGSAGYLEIAYNGDRADTRLNMGVGIFVNVSVQPAEA